MEENNLYIPIIAIGTLYALNVCKKRSFFCISSLLLLYTLSTFIGAWFLFYFPRTGFPYSTPQAMVFLSVAYVMFCLPLLFYDDSPKSHGERKKLNVEIDNRVLMVVAACGVAATLYFAADSIGSLKSFLSSGIDRETYRQGMVMERMTSGVAVVMNVLSSFSFASMFLAVYATLYGRSRPVAAALYVGSLGGALSMLKNIARSGVIELMLFCIACGLCHWRYLSPDIKKKAFRIATIVLALISIPFFAMTIARFARSDSPESTLYSTFSYFATGPYSFNADYEARLNLGVPSSNGALTFYMLPMVRDKLFGTSEYADGVDLHAEMHNPGFPEYKDLCGAYSAEFKTIVGGFLMDWPPGVVLGIFFFYCIFMIHVFRKDSAALGGRIVAAVYFYLILYASMGYGFSGRYRTTMLIPLVLLGILPGIVSGKDAGQSAQEQ